MMKKMVFSATIALSLIGCGGNADGVYVGMTEGGFLKPKFPVILDIKGDKALMNIADMKMLSMKAKLDGKVLSIHNKDNPNDSLKFHIINDGQTLQCNQCEKVGMPKIWEKNL